MTAWAATSKVLAQFGGKQAHCACRRKQADGREWRSKVAASAPYATHTSAPGVGSRAWRSKLCQMPETTSMLRASSTNTSTFSSVRTDSAALAHFLCRPSQRLARTGWRGSPDHRWQTKPVGHQKGRRDPFQRQASWPSEPLQSKTNKYALGP